MMIIWLLMAGFILLLILPILCASLYYKKRKGVVPFIDQEKVRDPRYFGKSFAALIEENLRDAREETIQLSKEEPYIDGDRQEEYPHSVDKLVICRNKEFHPLPDKIFLKEIYSKENCYIKGKVSLRAIYSCQNMVLGNDTTVVRWADAEGTLGFYDNCDLGISATSKIRLSVGKNCKFRRLFAPQICLGQYPGGITDPAAGKDEGIYRLSVQMDREKNLRYINKEMENEEGVVDFSVVSWKNITVTEKIIVKGDIRSHKGVRLCEGAVVVGNVFAEKDIILEKESCVLGNVFSQGDIYLCVGAAVGKAGTISSVIAGGRIQAEPKSFVFGYMSCEKQGEILGDKADKTVEIPAYLERIPPRKSLSFKSLEDFEGVDPQGFRFHNEIEEVCIPEGAKSIPKSMFFACTSIRRLKLPGSLEEIDDFAFAGCENLSEILLEEVNNLKRIGISAFENCSHLRRVELPASIKILDAATFAGCSNLEQLIFAEGTQLKTVGEHCLKRCKKLKEPDLPMEKNQEDEGIE